MLIAAICIVFLAGYLISAWQRREYISPDDMVIQADAEQEYEEFNSSHLFIYLFICKEKRVVVTVSYDINILL